MGLKVGQFVKFSSRWLKLIVSIHSTITCVSGACLFDYRIFKFPTLTISGKNTSMYQMGWGSKMLCVHIIYSLNKTLITSFYKLNQSPAHLFHCLFVFCYWNYFLWVKFFFTASIQLWLVLVSTVRWCVQTYLMFKSIYMYANGTHHELVQWYGNEINDRIFYDGLRATSMTFSMVIKLFFMVVSVL